MNTQLRMPELISQAQTWDNEFAETPRIPIEKFDVTSERLIVDGNKVPLSSEGRLRLLTKAGAAIGYMKDRSDGLQSMALTEHLLSGDFGLAPRVVMKNGEFWTLDRGDLVELGASQVLTAIAEALGCEADGLFASRIGITGERLELDLVSERKALEVRRGDVVRAGLHVVHCRYGDQATQIQSFLYRLVCENGMMQRECVSNGIARTRKLPHSHPRAAELQMDQIRRLAGDTWQALEARLAEFSATSERRTDVQQLLRQWVQKARISPRTANGDGRQTIMDRLLQSWHAEGAENTYFAAVNALTHVGTHDPELSHRQRRVLTLLGGLLAFSGVHICPRCFSVLGDGDGPPEATAVKAIAA